MPRGPLRRPMGIALVCDRCEQPIYLLLERPEDSAVCSGCGRGHPLRVDPDVVQRGVLRHCLRCGLDRLYVQKDFNKKLGIGIFAVAAVFSVPTWGVSLLAATLLDLGLYHVLGDVTICYACNTQHRGFARNPAHRAFDLHIAEEVDRQPRAIQDHAWR